MELLNDDLPDIIQDWPACSPDLMRSELVSWIENVWAWAVHQLISLCNYIK